MEIVPKNCVSVVEFWLDGFVRKIGHKVYLIGEQSIIITSLNLDS